MRMMSQTALARCTRGELNALLRQIAAELPNLAEGSSELRNAHLNLQNICRALARPARLYPALKTEGPRTGAALLNHNHSARIIRPDARLPRE